MSGYSSSRLRVIAASEPLSDLGQSRICMAALVYPSMTEFQKSVFEA
jgi:hypothetical protein